MKIGWRPTKSYLGALTAAVGDSWPVTVPLDEQHIGNKAVFDAAQGIAACDGEWLVLDAFIRSGWMPQKMKNRRGHDWFLVRDTRSMPVEVKTKQAEASDLGRLQFALRGLAMTSEGKYLSDFSWQWFGGEKLRRKAIAAYYDLFRTNLARINAILTAGLPLYDHVEIAKNTTAQLSIQRHDNTKLALDFALVDETVMPSERADNYLALIGQPTNYPGMFMSGTADARFMRALDATVLDELERYVFSTLGIVEQAEKRSPDTIVVLIWESPFYWQVPYTAIEKRWQEWCARVSVLHGILFPVGPFAPRVMLATDSARAVVPEDLKLNV